MRLFRIDTSKHAGGLDIHGLIGRSEFKQLGGNLHDLCVFSRATLVEPASAIKTGARHSFAKYLLFPVTLRRQFRTDTFDFTRVKCGAIRYKEDLFVIYKVPGHGFGDEPVPTNSDHDDRATIYRSAEVRR